MTTDDGPTRRRASDRRERIIVSGEELRDLWLDGKGQELMLGFALQLSVTSYLVATNQALNFLEQREDVSLTCRWRWQSVAPRALRG